MRLVADIGGTNARFRPTDGKTWLGEIWVGRTADYAQGEALVSAACHALQIKPAALDAVVLAVAGPVDDHGRVTMTNSALQIDAAVCSTALGCPVRVVNDFFALASGLPYLESVIQVGGQAPRADRTKALLGPGSGLGMACITPINDTWHVLPGEGGHANLAPTTHLESEIWSLLMQTLGHVSLETVLSGPGLVNLYRAVCQSWGNPVDESLGAAEITAQGVAMSDLVCHQTLETFASLLGSAAGNLALTVGAQGGVYIGGGVAQRLLEFLPSSPMRRRFDEKGQMADYVADIPLLLIAEEQPGLLGARACAAG